MNISVLKAVIITRGRFAQRCQFSKGRTPPNPCPHYLV